MSKEHRTLLAASRTLLRFITIIIPAFFNHTVQRTGAVQARAGWYVLH